MGSDAGEFQRVSERGWRNGLANLLRKENRTWWGSRRWLTQSLLWLVVVNGMVALALFALPLAVEMDPNQSVDDVDFVAIGLQALFQIGAIGMAVGVIILAQGLVIGERQSGVTEWILAKPVSRAAYILSKLIAHGIGVLVILVGLQSVVAYGLLSLASGDPLPLPSFVASVAGLALHTLFYLTLTLMMGVFAESRNRLLGVALGTLLGGMVLSSIVGRLALVTPWLLPTLLPMLALGEALPLPISLPMIATAAWCVVFIVAALWKFERLEF